MAQMEGSQWEERRLSEARVVRRSGGWNRKEGGKEKGERDIRLSHESIAITMPVRRLQTQTK